MPHRLDARQVAQAAITRRERRRALLMSQEELARLAQISLRSVARAESPYTTALGMRVKGRIDAALARAERAAARRRAQDHGPTTTDQRPAAA
jgi:predicted transcriptional regulator